MSHLLRPSDEEIRMLDIILDLHIEPNKPSLGFKYNRNATFFAGELKIDRFKSQSILNEFFRLGDEIGFLKGQKHGYGNWSLVAIDAYKAERFKNNGGFNRHFKSEIDTMTLKEKCNLVLASLFQRTKNDLDMVDDKDIINDTALGRSELSSCIKKLHNDGYTGGGKGLTSLEDAGRDFWEKGGYKENETSASNGNPITIIGDNNVLNQDSFFRESPIIHDVNTTPNAKQAAPNIKSWYETPLFKYIIWPVFAGLLIWFLTTYKSDSINGNQKEQIKKTTK